MEHLIGPEQADITLYLSTPPVLPDNTADPGSLTDQIISLNGNNWRKILTIFAKICAPDDDWRNFRDHRLLRQQGNISFAPTLRPHDGWHLLAGKACWQAFGYAPGKTDTFEALDENGRLFIRQRQILMPYPDYRQFPNSLIEQVKERMHPR